MVLEFSFYYLAAMILISSLLVISMRNPVHSVLFMLLLFFHIAALYLYLDAEFFAAIQIIVYAGAILVLFLFVVLLLDLKEETVQRRYVLQWPLALVTAAMLLTVMYFSLESFVLGPGGSYSIALIKELTHTKALGEVLYTSYIFPFEVASLILLVAMIGAIVLAKKRLKS
jgi:NADH-quinone oxidoreductase subunit J